MGLRTLPMLCPTMRPGSQRPLFGCGHDRRCQLESSVFGKALPRLAALTDRTRLSTKRQRAQRTHSRRQATRLSLAGTSAVRFPTASPRTPKAESWPALFNGVLGPAVLDRRRKTENREELIRRCRAKVEMRSVPPPSPAELKYGVPCFLDQLVDALQHHLSPNSEIGRSAARHGHDLKLQGFTVSQVVHDYGDVCQSITDLALQLNAPINVEDFRTLNRCTEVRLQHEHSRSHAVRHR